MESRGSSSRTPVPLRAVVVILGAVILSCHEDSGIPTQTEPPASAGCPDGFVLVPSNASLGVGQEF